jgi:uncharacterized tellurite resistance protein B-like protein
MFTSLLRRLAAPAPDHHAEPDARLALAALLVRLARADGLYSAEEVERIDHVLALRHGLTAFEAAALRHDAEELERAAPDTVRFTRAIKAAVPLTGRSDVMQAMWSVVLSDGLRDEDEDRLMRLVANLLGLTDVESALARQKAARA